MTQQDHTAPIYPVRVSRSERYQVVFQTYLDEAQTMPEILTGKTFCLDVKDQSGNVKIRLTEGAGISHPDSNAVMVSLSTVQMLSLPTGQYNAMLYVKTGVEHENFVLIKLTVE